MTTKITRSIEGWEQHIQDRYTHTEREGTPLMVPLHPQRTAPLEYRGEGSKGKALKRNPIDNVPPR